MLISLLNASVSASSIHIVTVAEEWRGCYAKQWGSRRPGGPLPGSAPGTRRRPPTWSRPRPGIGSTWTSPTLNWSSATFTSGKRPFISTTPIPRCWTSLCAPSYSRWSLSSPSSPASTSAPAWATAPSCPCEGTAGAASMGPLYYPPLYPSCPDSWDRLVEYF